MEHQDYARLYTKYKSKYAKAKYGQSGGGHNVDFIVREVDSNTELKKSIPQETIKISDKGIMGILYEKLRGENLSDQYLDHLDLVDMLHMIELMIKKGFIDISDDDIIRQNMISSAITINNKRYPINKTTILIDKGKINTDKNTTIKIEVPQGKLKEIINELKIYVKTHNNPYIYIRCQKKNPIDGTIANLIKPIRVEFSAKDSIHTIREKILRKFLGEYMKPDECGLFCRLTGKNTNSNLSILFDSETIEKIKIELRQKPNNDLTDFIIGTCCDLNNTQGAESGLMRVVKLNEKYVYDECISENNIKKEKNDKEYVDSFVCREISGNNQSWIKIPPTVTKLEGLDSDKFHKTLFEGNETKVIIWNVHIDLIQLAENVKKKLRTPPTSN